MKSLYLSGTLARVRLLARNVERSRSLTTSIQSFHPLGQLRTTSQIDASGPCSDKGFRNEWHRRTTNAKVASKRALSSPVPPSVETWWLESTTRLVDRKIYPVGSIDTLLWHKAEVMITYWAQRGPRGLDTCFQLLDRLSEEVATNPSSSFKLHVYLIHSILASWSKLFQNNQSNIPPSKMLQRLEKYLATAPGLFEPNIATYTIILDAASYCPDPYERIDFSEALLARLFHESEQFPQLRPNEVTIGTVLKAWSKSGSILAAQKAEGLLQQILELSNTEQWKDLSVNTVHYTTVLNAYANAGKADDAQRVLREMFEKHLVDGNLNVKPNRRSFTAVLSAWSKSSESDAFESAEQLLVQMIEMHQNGTLDEGPTVVCYNCLLNTLAKNARRVRDPLNKAESLMNDLLALPDATPTLVSFTALFRIVAGSDHPEKADKAKFWLATARKLGIPDERFLLDQFQTRLLRKGNSEKKQYRQNRR